MIKACYTTKRIPFIVDDADLPLVNSFKSEVVGRKNGKDGPVRTRFTVARLVMLMKVAIICNRPLRHSFITSMETSSIIDVQIDTRSENNHYNWRRGAIARLLRKVKCARNCGGQVTKVARHPSKRYMYLCERHLAKS